MFAEDRLQHGNVEILGALVQQCIRTLRQRFKRPHSKRQRTGGSPAPLSSHPGPTGASAPCHVHSQGLLVHRSRPVDTAALVALEAPGCRISTECNRPQDRKNVDHHLTPDQFCSCGLGLTGSDPSSKLHLNSGILRGQGLPNVPGSSVQDVPKYVARCRTVRAHQNAPAMGEHIGSSPEAQIACGTPLEEHCFREQAHGHLRPSHPAVVSVHQNSSMHSVN